MPNAANMENRFSNKVKSSQRTLNKTKHSKRPLVTLTGVAVVAQCA
jgi:hypothetical protein